MLKRSKTDDEIDLELSSTGGRVLTVNDDHDACELIARLVESAGWPADRVYAIDDVVGALTADHTAVVIDSLTLGVNEAFRALDDIRSGPADVRNVAVIIIATTDTNRLFAFQSGVDGFVVRPVHGEEVLDLLRLVLARSTDERAEYRRSQLMGGATI